MKIISDLHVHSRFARACSPAITLQGMEQTAIEKGINLIGTGDFTHPTWLKEIVLQLEETDGKGFFCIKGSSSGVKFVLSAEVCTISRDHDRVRKIHNCILMPSLDSVASMNEMLAKHADLSSDGRSIISISAAELVDMAIRADRDAFVFPAHAWTPYFGVFGAISGFDSMKEAYEDQEKHIYALEMGLSSDSPMNWRLSALDKYALISTSDMHSLPKIGRELTTFDLEDVSYRSMLNSIKEKDNRRFTGTVEFFPEEGKYHFDGHRQCHVSIDPNKQKGMTKCPKCGGKLVIGVLHRVNDLADRDPGYVAKWRPPFVKAVPLLEVVAYVMKKSTYSTLAVNTYDEMVRSLGTEYEILVSMDINRIADKFGEEISTAIKNMRDSNVTIEPGYDGVFGKVDLLNRDRGKVSISGWKQKML